ncbi:4Fe-4S binding protein [Wolinella succinogenes]|nr:4Fe-4S binding protein [Wolinella succinogenes]
MELLFSQLDCVGCGGCISACPTGAIDYAPIPRRLSMRLPDSTMRRRS